MEIAVECRGGWTLPQSSAQKTNNDLLLIFLSGVSVKLYLSVDSGYYPLYILYVMYVSVRYSGHCWC